MEGPAELALVWGRAEAEVWVAAAWGEAVGGGARWGGEGEKLETRRGEGGLGEEEEQR